LPRWLSGLRDNCSDKISTMSKDEKKELKVMVASTVYGFEDQLTQICAALKGYGYEVWNSHLFTIPYHPGKSNLLNCLAAVRNCDIVLGIIRPFYGSGVIGRYSITHREMRLAVELNKPRWFFVDDHVVFARQLLKQHRYTKAGKKRRFPFMKTSVMDDLRVIDIYDDVTQSNIPAPQRTGNWCQPYHSVEQLLDYIDDKFRDPLDVAKICREMK
jgi:Domain of unknown function (DUF4062)